MHTLVSVCVPRAEMRYIVLSFWGESKGTNRRGVSRSAWMGSHNHIGPKKVNLLGRWSGRHKHWQTLAKHKIRQTNVHNHNGSLERSLNCSLFGQVCGCSAVGYCVSGVWTASSAIIYRSFITAPRSETTLTPSHQVYVVGVSGVLNKGF